MKIQTQFKPYQPNQLLLLPPDMKQWLPEDDLAYFIMDVVNGLYVFIKTDRLKHILKRRPEEWFKDGSRTSVQTREPIYELLTNYGEIGLFRANSKKRENRNLLTIKEL